MKRNPYVSSPRRWPFSAFASRTRYDGPFLIVWEANDVAPLPCLSRIAYITHEFRLCPFLLLRDIGRVRPELLASPLRTPFATIAVRFLDFYFVEFGLPSLRNLFDRFLPFSHPLGIFLYFWRDRRRYECGKCRFRRLENGKIKVTEGGLQKETILWSVPEIGRYTISSTVK